MTDLKSPRLIYLKGFLFLVAGLVAAGLLLAQAPSWEAAFLLVIAVWSFCRAYYFAFYVIEKYVDPAFSFSGLGSFACYILRQRRSEPATAKRLPAEDWINGED